MPHRARQVGAGIRHYHVFEFGPPEVSGAILIVGTSSLTKQ